jgi:hypothetical protein
MYGASGVEFAEEAKKDIAEIVSNGFSTLSVCIAKTPKSLSDDPALLGRPYEHRCDTDETLAGLASVGIRPEVTTITYRSDQPFGDLDEACDFFMTYLGLAGPAPRAYLARFLDARLVRRDGVLIAPFEKAAAVITWPVAAHLT